MVRAIALDERAERPGVWSFGALGLTIAGLVAATAMIFAIDSELGRVRWWLVLAPLAISLAPIIVPRRAVRIGAAALLGGWCFVTGLTIGFLLLPAFAAQMVAVGRERS